MPLNLTLARASIDTLIQLLSTASVAAADLALATKVWTWNELPEPLDLRQLEQVSCWATFVQAEIVKLLEQAHTRKVHVNTVEVPDQSR